MTNQHWILGGVLALAGGLAMAGDAVDATSMGLSKTSVFDVPEPEPFAYNDVSPRRSEALPRAYPGAPPQIPHEVEGWLPIRAGANECLDCHDAPDDWGKELRRGEASPMPESHYTDRSGKLTKEHVAGARYVCTQCHTPQAENVKPLVENEFATAAKE
ncbi:MAG: nitrate reductase cytochrome c-type subunit [Chromatiales bacterium]|jgi:cytochrome c-type protein NapB